VSSETQPLLDVRDLRVRFRGSDGGEHHTVLDGVDLTICPGEIVGIIGETGSGKTTLIRAIAGLVPPNGGTVTLEGEDITRLSRRHRRALRRSGAIQLVFQDSSRALDPSLPIWQSVTEGLAIRGQRNTTELRGQAARVLELVGLDPELADRRPGAVSGGQRQRVAIARAIVLDPKLVLCDEPVSALDASNRHYVLQMLHGLRDRLGISMAIISHDLTSMVGVVDRVVVLSDGRVVEEGPTSRVFAHPEHEYTQELIAAAPRALRERAVALTVTTTS
jgi:ABC-type glutathione transport system ATPase component